MTQEDLFQIRTLDLEIEQLEELLRPVAQPTGGGAVVWVIPHAPLMISRYKGRLSVRKELRAKAQARVDEYRKALRAMYKRSYPGSMYKYSS